MLSIKSFLIIAGIFLFTFTSYSQITDDIILNLKSGNSKNLSKFFNQNVELVVFDSDNVYRKTQAQFIMNNFFSNNPPQSFSIIHQGGKEDSKYLIGKLFTKKGIYRVYFFLKKNEGEYYIHQLKIEKQ